MAYLEGLALLLVPAAPGAPCCAWRWTGCCRAPGIPKPWRPCEPCSSPVLDGHTDLTADCWRLAGWKQRGRWLATLALNA